MDVNDETDKTNKLNSEKFWVFNPMDSEFVFYWDSKQYKIPAMSSKAFPHYLKEHAVNKLIDAMINKDNNNGYITEKIRNTYRKKIEV